MQAATVEHEAGVTASKSLLPLDTLGGTIKAHITAGDKATDKAEEHYKAAGIHLSEAKERVAHTKGLTWTAFLIKNCSIGSRRADELISIADGRTSLADVRERARTSMAASRAKQSAQRCAESSEKTEQKQQNRLSDDDGESGDDGGAAPAQVEDSILYAIQRINENARVFNKILKASAFDREAVDRINTAIDRMIGKWRSIQSTLEKKGILAPKKLSPAALKARRKSMADSKTHDDYFKQFGALYGVLDRARHNLMAASLASGVDQLAGIRREQQEYADKQAEHVREETLRRATLNEPLLAPITPEKEQACTDLIKTRQLYEGACGLSWAEYFEYRQHHGCIQLTRSDLAYAAQYTACAIVPEMDESEVTEKSLRWRALRIGYKVRRRGTEYSLCDESGSSFGGSLAAVINWLDLITPTMEGNEQEALAA